MNLDAYNAVRKDADSAGIAFLDRGWIRLHGRDRQSFLNGQITNDVLHLEPGNGVHACLLNNVGHMLANMYVHASDESLWIETAAERAGLVSATLKRYLIREKVVIEDWTNEARTITIQGSGARRVVGAVLGREMADCCLFPLANEIFQRPNPVDCLMVHHIRACTPIGFDLTVRTSDAESVYSSLLRSEGVHEVDRETLDLLRIEAGIPRWGAELDETVIPLEANLDSAINQNKGCYMGQEVIARILSRGHTNRSLVGVKLDRSMPAGSAITADTGTRRSQEVGRLTSMADSPEAGLIAMGYVRNEYCELGAELMVEGAKAVVTALPFVA